MLQQKIQSRQGSIVLYGVTPPRAETPQEKQSEIAEQLVQRITGLGLDGLVIYDIQDESTRISEERPFPFMATLDGFDYSERCLQSLTIPRIVYRSVGKYKPEALHAFFSADSSRYLSVLVGVPSKNEKLLMTLDEAYAMYAKLNKPMLIGGVTIPERHRRKGDEHLRLAAKRNSGCSFFISQGVYDLDAAKSLISDCYYHAQQSGGDVASLIFTFTPCGSVKTLQFMKWLGISVPRWLENDLMHASDILEKSLDVCVSNWRELKAFADEKGICIGANIESVSIRKVEIEASIELVKQIRAYAP